MAESHDDFQRPLNSLFKQSIFSEFTMAAGQPIATVVAVIGKAFARNEAGDMRTLKPGDVLLEGETVITNPGGHVELALGNSLRLEIQPEDVVKLTAELVESRHSDVSENVVQQSTIGKVLQALQQGKNLDSEVEDPGAGLEGGDRNHGSSFVQLLRIAEGVSPLGFEFNSPHGDTPPPPLTSPNDDHLGTTAGASSAPLPTLSISSSSIAESGGFTQFTVNLSSASSQATTFNLTLSNGTALAGSDYTNSTEISLDGGVSWTSAASATLPAGSTSLLVRVPILDDTVTEPNETFDLTATVTSGNTSNTNATASATILDDDAIPTLSVNNVSVVEGNHAVFTVTLSNPTTSAVTFTPALASGSATVGTDTASTLEFSSDGGVTWNPVAGNVSILTGSTSVLLRVATVDDVYAEGAETFTLNAAVVSGNTGNASASGTATITDDADVTTVSLSATPSVAEGGSIVYTASLTNAAGSAMTVTLSNSAVINIAAGASSGSVTVPAHADTVYVDAAPVSATIATTSGGSFESLSINPAAAVTSVTDTLDTTTVTLSASAASVVEGSSIVYTATVSNAVTSSPLVISLDNGQTITIPVGSSTANSAPFAVRPDDAIAQGTQTLTVGISSTSGGNYEALNTSSTTSTTVTDDADVTTVSLLATPSVAEGGSIVYTASLTNAAGSAMTVTLSNGATINIASGASSGSVAVPAHTDTVYVDAGNTSATITTTSGGSFESLSINPAAAVTSVTDTIDTTTLSITGSASVIEGGTAAYTVSLTHPAQTAVTVNLNYSGTASNGSDFTGVATVTIAAGTSSANFNLATIDDTLAEGTESIIVTLASPSGGNYENLVISGSNGSVTTMIADNDGVPTIQSISSPTVQEGTDLVYSVVLSNGSASSTVFPFTLGGGTAVPADYGSPAFSNGVTLSAGVLTVPAGVTSFTMTLPTIDDALNETNETVPLTIGGTTGTGTIIDNDATPTLSINDVTVNEAAGTATFTVSLSAASGQTVNVNFATSNGTATAGADYTATSGTLTFAPGVTTQTVTVSILNDTLYEVSENFNVNLSSPVNATIADGLGIGTIRDDGTGTGGSDNDAPFVTTVSSPSVTEGGNLDFTVSLSNLSTSSTSVAVNLAGVSATLGVDTGAALVSTDGGATFAPLGATVSVPAGALSFIVRMPTINDTLTEANETLTLAASTPINGSAVLGTGTIIDNDAVPTLDLDANNSSGASGNNYTTTFTENGAAVAIADVDIAIADSDSSTLASAAITLTNAKAGDLLNVGALPAGISATFAGNVITLSGSATLANYQNAIRAISFSNSSENPDTTPRDITVTVNDGGNDSVAAHATINVVAVNDTPFFTGTGPFFTTTNEDVTLVYSTATNTIGDVDAGNAIISMTVSATNGTVTTGSTTGLTFTSGSNGSSNFTVTGTLANLNAAFNGSSFSPAANFSGLAQVTLTVNDLGNTGIDPGLTGGPGNEQATTVLNITVNPVNDAPQGTDATLTISEDNTHIFTTANFGFSDPNDTPANAFNRVEITTLPSAGTLLLNGIPVTAGQFVTVTDINSGLLRFAPATNANGNAYASFTFQVEDNGGTANGGVNLDPTPNTITFNVTPINDAPQGSNATFTINEDTNHVLTVANFGFSDPNDTPANAFINVQITTLPTAGTLLLNGAAIIAGQFISVSDINSGLLVFHPASNANGVGYANFTFQVQDDGGTLNGGVNLDPTPNTITFNVTPVNDPPVAVDDAATTPINAAITVDVKSNDTDVDDLNSTLIISAPSVNPAQGTVVLNPDGTLTFTPANNFTGAATITYTVSDPGGLSDTGTLVVSVGNNTPPTGADNSTTILEDGSKTFAAVDFGFSDVDAGQFLNAVRIDTLPGAGSLTLSGTPVTAGQVIPVGQLGNLVFSPVHDANGNNYANFTFSVQDNGGAFDTVPNTFTVNVTAVNDAPVAVADVGAVNEDATLSANAANGVIQKAPGTDTDVDN
ncbi:MAG: retention module-containing protein, partial [Burkholderiaceae bacterium]